MYDTLYAILNNSENATLQYFIFCKKALNEKYLLKLNNVFKTSSKRFVEVNSYFVFKALFTEFCNCAFAIVIRLIRIRHTCVALMRKKTVLPLETSSEINFKFIKCVKKCKTSPFDTNK